MGVWDLGFFGTFRDFLGTFRNNNGFFLDFLALMKILWDFFLISVRDFFRVIYPSLRDNYTKLQTESDQTDKPTNDRYTSTILRFRQKGSQICHILCTYKSASKIENHSHTDTHPATHTHTYTPIHTQTHTHTHPPIRTQL